MGWRFDDRSVSVDYLEAGHGQAAAITSSQGISGKNNLIADDLLQVALFRILFQCPAGAASPVGKHEAPGGQAFEWDFPFDNHPFSGSDRNVEHRWWWR